MSKRWKKTVRGLLILIGGILILAMHPEAVDAGGTATNSANNVIGGSHTLSPSGDVEVVGVDLRLVKQVWVNISGTWTCKASSVTTAPPGGEPDDRCDASGPGSVSVPSGTTVKFLIYVRNRSDINLTDLHFEDILDVMAGVSGGFTYTTPANEIKRNAGGLSDTATVNAIFTNVDGASCPGAQCMTNAADGDIASYAAGTGPDQDRITVGNHAVQDNGTLALNANETFAILFQATKN